ncbi:MAG: ABC transporter transmembrane domain-containing protein, partial [Gammaproteobacteria bacterium]|nr:ABC transporter transmembrane domain-containing protein [Gammaproteobacteria bacterium]
MVNACAGFLLSARPLVLAPALDVFVEKQAKPAGNLSELTLNNVGPTLASMLDFDLDNVLAVGTTVAILFVSVTLLIATLQFATQYSLVRVKTALTYDMMTALHRHLLFLPLGYFHKRRIGDTVSRVSVDVTNTTASLESFSRSIMIAVAQIALTAVMLFRTDMLFATLVVGLGMLHMWITRVLSKRVRSGAAAVAEG